MKVYQVSYDLRGATMRDYQRLWGRLGLFKSHRIMKSTWLIATKLTAEELNDILKAYIGKGRIFISEVTSNRQGWMSKTSWEWLKKVKPPAFASWVFED